MTAIDCVVVDLAPHPQVSWAVVHGGQLIPMRFKSEREAADHLELLLFSKVNPVSGCPRCGRRLQDAMADCEQPTCPLPIPKREAA